VLAILDWLVAALIGIHFGIPLIYFAYFRNIAKKPWDIKIDDKYRPMITVILPTYNESEIIKERLDNLDQQEYPRSRMEVIVVDCSNDGTADIVEKWFTTTMDPDLKILKEKARGGKLHALEAAIEHVSEDCKVVVFTDADAFWEHDALARATNYLADPHVGAITASITYRSPKNRFLENTYRNYYNVVRVGESKVHSTPVHNGPFLAIKWDLLREAGLPTFVGSDDSAFGSSIAFRGYRALQVDDIIVEEPVRGNQVLRRIRRAQHLLLNFHKTKGYMKAKRLYRKSSFDNIWKLEWWLHVINPWLLLISILFLLIDVMWFKSLIGLVLLATGLTFLVWKTFRMWILQQLYLIAAATRNLWTKAAVWKK